MVVYIHWFSNIELDLHPWNKLHHFAVVYTFFVHCQSQDANILLNILTSKFMRGNFLKIALISYGEWIEEQAGQLGN